MHLGTKIVRIRLLAVAAASLLAASPALSTAQAAPTGATPPKPSLFDFTAEYGYIHPFDSSIKGISYQPIQPGVVASIAGYFNHSIGLQVEGGIFIHGPNDSILTLQIGPIFRTQRGRFVPWAHVLGGTSRVAVQGQGGIFGYGATAGAGLDYIVPGLGEHIALRPIQADYTWSHVDYGSNPNPYGGIGIVNAYRLTTGTILRFDPPGHHLNVQLGCTAQPVDVFPGDPLTVTAAPANLNSKKKETYVWSTSGGQITGTEETASVATTGLAPGDYTVTGHVYNGSKASQQAACTTGFRVHNYEPPTIALSVNPASVLAGQPVTVTASGRSPQNRPLTYSYGATSGEVSGSGATATVATTGASPGTITISGKVVDDLGQEASATAVVAITAPPPPPPPPATPGRSLCDISFDRDKKRPVRVDNEAKGCLDEIALVLNRESAAKLIIVGHHDASEPSEAAAERALNVEQYFVDEKGIDPGRLELRSGDGFSRTVEHTLLPPGASFDPAGTATFNSGSIQRHGQPYATPAAPGRPKKIRKSAN